MASLATRWNLDALESAYEDWRRNPASVDETWQLFFAGFTLGTEEAPRTDSSGQRSVICLIDAYRELGHFLAHLDPLTEPPVSIPLLELAEFGLQEHDLERNFDLDHFLGLERGTLHDLLAALRATYCRTIGVEYMHIQDMRLRRWLQERMEPCRNHPGFAPPRRRRILADLHAAELFERFLHTSYVGQKRFSLEGAETLIPILNALVDRAAGAGVKEIVLGMSHRGRLNVLANILGRPLAEIFSEFEDNFLPLSSGGDGDVRYHVGFSSDRAGADGTSIHLSLSPNPSHVEALNPVVEGRMRAKQQCFDDRDRTRGVPVLIHGDAAFAAQGVVAETLNLSQLSGFTTGGTVHVVVNNQIGFTTSPADARSTVYCTDVAKAIEAPIFHVNAEDTEAAVFVTELAFDCRQAFHRDVVIDLVCYRRHGHNESDDPSFTQPLMYAKIKERSSLSRVYTERLIQEESLTEEESQRLDEQFQARLQAARDEVKNQPHSSAMRGYGGQWTGFSPCYSHDPVETGVAHETLVQIVTGLTRLPDGFHAHPKIARALASRLQDVQAGKPVDWALGEALAFGSLLIEGTSVRLSGQDCRRGTFSQRHAVLVDQQTGAEHVPLANLASDQATFFVYDSPLSENAVLGFEYGYSLDAPDTLVLWEAQFGDFANGAQVIIDQFLVCGQSKWQRDSGLVLLLPHGYEGQGPEHSSARLERFLQMCAEDNLQVCNPSTPAQYFHLLRRQMRRKFRKPLIVMTPKSLLRHKRARSPLEALSNGHFHEILEEPAADPARVRRVLLCSGKVYYDLTEMEEAHDARLAIIRVEQLYPLEEKLLGRALRRFRKAREVIWVQEESQNMGAWSFMEPRLRAQGVELQYVGRDASASPAAGSRPVHVREQHEIVEAALKGKAPHLVAATPSSQLQHSESRWRKPDETPHQNDGHELKKRDSHERQSHDSFRR
jgi:2-oxoglutarate dehydrogenase E1 component